ncbi:hypothetical protein [Desulfosarcina variabilis]
MRQVPLFSCHLTGKDLFACRANALLSRQQLPRASGLGAQLKDLFTTS